MFTHNFFYKQANTVIIIASLSLISSRTTAVYYFDIFITFCCWLLLVEDNKNGDYLNNLYNITAKEIKDNIFLLFICVLRNYADFFSCCLSLPLFFIISNVEEIYIKKKIQNRQKVIHTLEQTEILMMAYKLM